MITTTLKNLNGDDITVSGKSLRELEYNLRNIYDAMLLAICNHDNIVDSEYLEIGQTYPGYNHTKELGKLLIPIDKELFPYLLLQVHKLLDREIR